jgi:hypothetical protein
MTNNKQQTAVEWLAKSYVDLLTKVNNEEISLKEFEIQYIELLEQAKEMEKEQISKAFDDGDYNYHYSRKTGDDFEDGKEYFNEVYG